MHEYYEQSILNLKVNCLITVLILHVCYLNQRKSKIKCAEIIDLYNFMGFFCNCTAFV